MEEIKNFNLSFWEEEILVDLLEETPELSNWSDDKLKEAELKNLYEFENLYESARYYEDRADAIRLYREKRKEYREKNGI